MTVDSPKLPRRVINPAAGCYHSPRDEENGELDVQETPACARPQLELLVAYWQGGWDARNRRMLRYWATGRGAGKTKDGVWRVTSCDQRLMDATIAGVVNADQVPLQIVPVEQRRQMPGVESRSLGELSTIIEHALVQLDLISRSVDNKDQALMPGNAVQD